MTRPVGGRSEATALILHFLHHVRDARKERIVRYMETTPLSFVPGTTRNTIMRLVRQGRIARSGRGRYQCISTLRDTLSDTEGGVEWELAQAEHAIIAAGSDQAALAVAFRRHAEAIRNMMQSAIVPAFVDLVDRTLKQRLDPVADAITGLRTDVQASAQDVAARLGKHDDDIEKVMLRLDAIDNIEEWRTGVDGRLSKIEQADRDDIRAEIKDIKIALAQYEEKHQELIERLSRHGNGQ
jgi:hypothetical protein